MRVLDQYNRPEHWGVNQVLTPVWAANQLRTVLYKPPYRVQSAQREAQYCVPITQSLLLTAKITDGAIVNYTNHVFRWVIGIGGGGGKATVKLDLLRTQQLSVAGENLTIDVVCERCDISPAAAPFIAPGDVTVTAGASVADGNVGSSAATYTQVCTLPPAADYTIEIPAMATSFRIVGSTSGTTSPFQAAVIVAINGHTSGESYTGTQLLTTAISGAFIPLNGLAQSMQLLNGTVGTVVPIIEWGLDL